MQAVRVWQKINKSFAQVSLFNEAKDSSEDGLVQSRPSEVFLPKQKDPFHTCLWSKKVKK